MKKKKITPDLYVYKAFIRKVIDGDSVRADIDLGFGVILSNQSVRLIRIDAPEIRGKERPEGLKSKEALKKRVEGKWIYIKSSKDKKGKYGRWLAELWDDDTCINDWLISEGLAKPYGS